MRKAIVTITNDLLWTDRDYFRVADNISLQLFRINVRIEGEDEQHLIVNALDTSIDRAQCTTASKRLRALNPIPTISFHVADREGWAQVITEPDQAFDRFTLAAAVGVVKTTCVWDESPSILVAINDDIEVRVWPRFDGQHWVATGIEE